MQLLLLGHGHEGGVHQLVFQRMNLGDQLLDSFNFVYQHGMCIQISG
jgi:hypothetical protein